MDLGLVRAAVVVAGDAVVVDEGVDVARDQVVGAVGAQHARRHVCRRESIPVSSVGAGESGIASAGECRIR